MNDPGGEIFFLGRSSIETEGSSSGVDQPVNFSLGASERRMFRSSVDGQEIDLAATDSTSVLVREAIYKEIAMVLRRCCTIRPK